MDVLIISGSPRKNKNCEKLAEYAKEKLIGYGLKVKILKLSELHISACNACNYCKEKFECKIKDDMQKVYEDLINAKALLIISPTYFGNVSAQLKAFMDRTLVLRRNNFMLKDKFGGAIAIGGSRNGGQEFVINAIHNFFHIHGMIPLGDDAHFGGILYGSAEDRIGLKTVDNLLLKIRRLLH